MSRKRLKCTSEERDCARVSMRSSHSLNTDGICWKSKLLTFNHILTHCMGLKNSRTVKEPSVNVNVIQNM